jgi:hypothetical protein
MWQSYAKINMLLCMRAQRQALAAFIWAIVHHIPVTIWEEKNV